MRPDHGLIVDERDGECRELLGGDFVGEPALERFDRGGVLRGRLLAGRRGELDKQASEEDCSKGDKRAAHGGSPNGTRV